MTLKLLGAAAAAAVLALSGCSNWGGKESGASGGASGTGKSSQDYPAGSTATPSGRSPGQGSGVEGSATTGTPQEKRAPRGGY